MTVDLSGIEQRDQRQDSLADQLRDLAPVANRLGMYDAADFIEEVIGSDRVKNYGATRTVRLTEEEKKRAAESVLGRGSRGEREGCMVQEDDQ